MMDKTEKQYRENIGRRISQLRVNEKMTQKSLAEKMGVSGQQLHNYENGISNIAAHKIVLCAKALNKPISYFYETCEENFQRPTSNIVTLATEIDQLPKEGIDIMVSMMRNLNRMSEINAELERRKKKQVAA